MKHEFQEILKGNFEITNDWTEEKKGELIDAVASNDWLSENTSVSDEEIANIAYFLGYHCEKKNIAKFVGYLGQAIAENEFSRETIMASKVARFRDVVFENGETMRNMIVQAFEPDIQA